MVGGDTVGFSVDMVTARKTVGETSGERNLRYLPFARSIMEFVRARDIFGMRRVQIQMDKAILDENAAGGAFG